MTLTLLHTARAHIARFDALRDRIAPDVKLTHVVRPDLLDRIRAEKKPSPDLKADIAALIDAAKGTVLCTCSSIGPVAERSGAIRIDRPMMEAAADRGRPICLAYTVRSTALVSGDLLAVSVARSANPGCVIRPLLIEDAWDAFEGGNQIAYAQLIASAIRAHLAAHRDTRTVVLAQASMDVALPFLTGVGAEVLAPAELAFRSAIRA